MESPKRADYASLIATAALLWSALGLPAAASQADPGRSHAAVQAPVLAPGVWGTAPLYGELDPSGAFRLNAPTSAVTTGNPFYDAFLHRTLGSTITLIAASPRVLTARGRVKLMGVNATVFVAGRSASVPLTVRTVKMGNGTWLRAYCSVGLAAYGIRSATGGPPGPLGVAINAFFPGY